MIIKEPKISDKQFMIRVNGPSCGGKSSFVEVLMGQYCGLFNAHADEVRWLISRYEPLIYRPVTTEMTLALAEIAFQNGFSLIREGTIVGENDDFVSFAEAKGIPVFFVNISAPKPILDGRFQERMAASRQGAKVGNLSQGRFDGFCESYLEHKPSTPLEFDSSEASAEEMAQRVAEYIQGELAD